MEQHQEIKKESFPLILTVSLVLVALFVFLIGRKFIFPNRSLLIPISLFSIIDVGFIVALVLGVRTKNISIKIISVIINTILFLLCQYLYFCY